MPRAKGERRLEILKALAQMLEAPKWERITTAALAEKLEVSARSVYRDIADLMAQGVPIRGEAGVGYQLDRAFDMPPLMLTSTSLGRR